MSDAFKVGDKVLHRITNSEYTVIDVRPEEIRLDGYAGWFLSSSNELVSFGADPEPETFDKYDERMLPMFKKLADAATAKGWCSEYDAIVGEIGAPSRDEIKRLTTPGQRKAWDEMPIGAKFQFENGNYADLVRVKVSDDTYFRPAYDRIPGELRPVDGISSSRIIKVLA